MHVYQHTLQQVCTSAKFSASASTKYMQRTVHALTTNEPGSRPTCAVVAARGRRTHSSYTEPAKPPAPPAFEHGSVLQPVRLSRAPPRPSGRRGSQVSSIASVSHPVGAARVTTLAGGGVKEAACAASASVAVIALEAARRATRTLAPVVKKQPLTVALTASVRAEPLRRFQERLSPVPPPPQC